MRAWRQQVGWPETQPGEAGATRERRWVGLSYSDPNGRVFEQDDRILRAIGAERAGFYRQLLKNPTIVSLMAEGLLVESWIPVFDTPGAELVVEHKRVATVSYPFEWSPELLREAASATLRIEQRLRPAGLTLQDAHPWNLLFDGTRPVFIDLGSIVPLADRDHWQSAADTQRWFVNPLALASEGRAPLVRQLLSDPVNNAGIPADYLERHPRQSRRVMRELAFARLLRRLRPSPLGADERAIEAVRRYVEGINMPTETSRAVPRTDLTITDPTLAVIDRVLRELRPESVVDLSGLDDRLAWSAAAGGARTVALGREDYQMGAWYRAARTTSTAVLPLVMNVANPSPAMGICLQSTVPATTRLRADCALAVGLHATLTAEMQLTGEQMAKTVALFTRRWAVVDVPRTHRHEMRDPRLSGESFAEALAAQFREVTCAALLDDRVLLVCEGPFAT